MTQPRGHTVLVVEDDVDIRESIAEVLVDNDYEAVVAENGEQAIAALQALEGRPCVILLDLMMPVMDGFQFRAAQARDPALRVIPVVVLSAHVDLPQAADDLAADAYLRKPVELRELLATVGRFCDAHG